MTKETESFEERFDEVLKGFYGLADELIVGQGWEEREEKVKDFIRTEKSLSKEEGKKEERERIIKIMGESWRNTIEQNPISV